MSADQTFRSFHPAGTDESSDPENDGISALLSAPSEVGYGRRHEQLLGLPQSGSWGFQMLKRSVVLVTALATVAATFGTGASAEEVVLAPDGGSKDVVESETGSYIVVMEEDPVVVTVGQDGLDTAEADGIAADLEAEQNEVLADIGGDASDKVNTYTSALNGFSAAISYDEAQALAANPKVALVLPDELHQATHYDEGPHDYLELGVHGGAWDTGLTGEGVIVGVIDNGIWPEHPSFADDGSYPDLGIALDPSRPTCEFGNAAHATDPSIGPDDPFTCNNKLLGARQMLDTYRTFIGATPFEYYSARDDDGHGTHTASTAAGNADVHASMYGNDLGIVSGIAPRARVIAYKGLGALGGFTSDLAAAIDQAVLDGVDVINYSVGGGSSVPTGGDDLAFLFAADAGVFVATSAGNSGPGDDTVGSPGNAPWLTTVGANTQTPFYRGTVRTKGGPNVKGASLTPELRRTDFVDAEDFGNELCLADTFAPGSLDGKVVLCRRGAIGRAAKGFNAAAAGAVGMVLYNFDDNDSLFTDTHAVPAVHINFTDGQKMKTYIDDRVAAGKTPQVAIRNTGKETRAKGTPSMTYFSSRGPNGPVPDIIKPDITAPGHQIVAGDSPGVNAFGDSFQAISGTSMSSPHVAGLFALLKQAHPDWSAAAAKSAIMTTANTKVRTEDRKTRANPFQMGAGEIDPGIVEEHNSAFEPGLVYDAGLFEYAAFTCGADYGIFTQGSCDFLDSIGVPSDASDLNYPSIGVAELAGSQTVVRTVTSVAHDGHTVDYRAKVKAPDGYSVTVSPKRFSIAPGESQDLEITITNVGAPAGEWRFGSLELKGYEYNVRSAIAVKGALFDAPDQIDVTGEAGSTSFDVLFGYTGSYGAGAHGLAPSEVKSGTIGQDPDATYPSGDDAPGPAGGVDKFPITVTDAALLRIALTIPGDDDIDLFLEDATGTIIATSTNGGTDELIDLVLPANGDYTLVVHGWGIPSVTLDYNVDTWQVPLPAGGGSLAIDSAPTSAALGASGTVTASWAGLAPGSYLGAVSHTGDAGLLGLTLIGVQVEAPPT